ncbi:PREDICTED: uncharacterized protein LOC109584729 [Amphimedon queenslandica]|uniref:Uncharacterized protein n=1 Tax=Amphimedon queenslandica TaxID=400682 RepID=A0A1X7U4K2_AMPQE|nr:PREDICTED: uncharacterized protein LOC109584729 [Amphimedon queenslandica]|eukprot:XP_019856117.1 PREDICTED: uncharacterized protein LOC109584729 [Amphimedon queenslandica]
MISENPDSIELKQKDGYREKGDDCILNVAALSETRSNMESSKTNPVEQKKEKAKEYFWRFVAGILRLTSILIFSIIVLTVYKDPNSLYWLVMAVLTNMYIIIASFLEVLVPDLLFWIFALILDTVIVLNSVNTIFSFPLFLCAVLLLLLMKKEFYSATNVIHITNEDGAVFLVYVVLWALGILICITNAARFDAAKTDSIGIGPGISVISMAILAFVIALRIFKTCKEGRNESVSTSVI